MIPSLTFWSWSKKIGYFCDRDCNCSTWFWGPQHNFWSRLRKWTDFVIMIGGWKQHIWRGPIAIVKNELNSRSWLEAYKDMLEGSDRNYRKWTKVSIVISGYKKYVFNIKTSFFTRIKQSLTWDIFHEKSI